MNSAQIINSITDDIKTILERDQKIETWLKETWQMIIDIVEHFRKDMEAEGCRIYTVQEDKIQITSKSILIKRNKDHIQISEKINSSNYSETQTEKLIEHIKSIIIRVITEE